MVGQGQLFQRGAVEKDHRFDRFDRGRKIRGTEERTAFKGGRSDLCQRARQGETLQRAAAAEGKIPDRYDPFREGKLLQLQAI